MTSIAVTFTGTWITDPTTHISVHALKGDRAEQDTLNGSVRTYAGGRRRSITTPADVRQSGLTLQRVSGTDVEILRGWRGRVLLLRDFQGWRRWGTFYAITPISVFQGPGVPPLYTVTLAFVDLDFSEGV